MAVAIGSVGTIAAAAAQTVSPAFPTGVTAGDALLLVRAAKPDTAALTTPSGWTLLFETAGGSGVFGNDTGPVRCAVYWRQADGSETGTVSCSSTVSTVDVQQAVISRYTKSPSATWDVAASGGVDSTQSTDWTVTASPALALATGDAVQVSLSWPTDSARTWSAEGLSAAGATITVLGSTPLVAAATGLGADMASRMHAFTVTAGSSSTGPTYTGTVNSATNVTGASTMARLREVSAGSVDGVIAATLPAFTATVAAAARVFGSVAATLPAVMVEVDGAARNAGAVSALVAAIQGELVGAARNTAVLDLPAPGAHVDLVAVGQIGGAFDITLPAAVAELGEAPGTVIPGIHAAGSSRPTLTPGVTRSTLAASTNRG